MSEPGAKYMALLEPYWDIPTEDPGQFATQFRSIPIVCQHLLAAHIVTVEVSNGGFAQLCYNSTGLFIPTAPFAFEAIGMPKTAAVVERAIEWLGEPFPVDRDEREKRMMALSDLDDEEMLEALDEAFFEVIDNEAGGFDFAADAYAAKAVQ